MNRGEGRSPSVMVPGLSPARWGREPIQEDPGVFVFAQVQGGCSSLNTELAPEIPLSEQIGCFKAQMIPVGWKCGVAIQKDRSHIYILYIQNVPQKIMDDRGPFLITQMAFSCTFCQGHPHLLYYYHHFFFPLSSATGTELQSH